MLNRFFPGVPMPAVGLGLAGLIPFYACAVAAVALPGGQPQAYALTLLLAYGAIILSFLGGVHWGLAMAGFGAPSVLQPMDHPPKSMSWKRLGWSVAPSIAGWAAFFHPNAEVGLVILMAAFLATLFGDLKAMEAEAAPTWYLPLRHVLTGLVLVALGIGLGHMLL